MGPDWFENVALAIVVFSSTSSQKQPAEILDMTSLPDALTQRPHACIALMETITYPKQPPAPRSNLSRIQTVPITGNKIDHCPRRN